MNGSCPGNILTVMVAVAPCEISIIYSRFRGLGYSCGLLRARLTTWAPSRSAAVLPRSSLYSVRGQLYLCSSLQQPLVFVVTWVVTHSGSGISAIWYRLQFVQRFEQFTLSLPSPVTALSCPGKFFIVGQHCCAISASKMRMRFKGCLCVSCSDSRRGGGDSANHVNSSCRYPA